MLKSKFAVLSDRWAVPNPKQYAVKKHSTRRRWIFKIIAFLAIISADHAKAQSCSGAALPYALTNGATADASQVMADLNCAGVYGLAHAGNVGIGTTNPSTQLDVNGSINISNNNSYFFTGVSGYGASLTAQSDNNLVLYNNGPGGVYPVFYHFMNGNGPFTFYSPVEFLNSYTNVSDVRLKKNIQGLTGGLTIIQNLRPVTYDWRAASERSVGKKLTLPLNEHQMGFIAQELQKVLPDAVRTPTEPDGVYSIKEQNLIPVLVEALKEQQAEIQSLQAQMASMKALIK